MAVLAAMRQQRAQTVAQETAAADMRRLPTSPSAAHKTFQSGPVDRGARAPILGAASALIHGSGSTVAAAHQQPRAKVPLVSEALLARTSPRPERVSRHRSALPPIREAQAARRRIPLSMEQAVAAPVDREESEVPEVPILPQVQLRQALAGAPMAAAALASVSQGRRPLRDLPGALRSQPGIRPERLEALEALSIPQGQPAPKALEAVAVVVALPQHRQGPVAWVQ